MREISKEELNEMLKNKGFDPRISWFYTQFKDKFEEEYNIYDLDFEKRYGKLINFLNGEHVKEILFFTEPSGGDFDLDINPAFVKTDELRLFLNKNVNMGTNTHVADKSLKWIFTITHDGDFFISGSRELTKKFIKFFKGAEIMSRAEIEAKWASKKHV